MPRKPWEVTALVTFIVNGCNDEADVHQAVDDLKGEMVTGELELRKTITVLAVEVRHAEEMH